MNKLFLVISFLVYFSSFSMAQIKLEIKLIGKNQIYECEPIWIRLSWENTSQEEIKIGAPNRPAGSDATYIWINGNIKNIPQDIKILPSLLAPSTLKPGERIEDSIDLRTWNLENGYYKIKAIADFRRFPQDHFHGIIESNMIEFKIEVPQGIDLQAWDEAQKKALNSKGYNKELGKLNTCFQLSIEDFIIKSYPTSIYAGWILLGGSGYADDSSDVKYLKKADPEKFQGKVKERIMIANSGIYEHKQIEIISNYIHARPDFALADQLKYKIAFLRAFLGEYKEAIVILEELVQSNQTSDIIKRKSKSLLEAIKDKQK